jgi:hypothetical protein
MFYEDDAEAFAMYQDKMESSDLRFVKLKVRELESPGEGRIGETVATLGFREWWVPTGSFSQGSLSQSMISLCALPFSR